MGKLTLRKVHLKDKAFFQEQQKNFSKEDNFNFAYGYSPDRPFSEYLDWLAELEKGLNLKEGDVPATLLLAIVENRVVGRISIRHSLNDFLSRIGGHVGYGVIREHRGKGYGTQILKEGLKYIENHLNLDRILVTCDQDNISSLKIIENNGGVFEGLYDEDDVQVPKRRYWITISDKNI